MTMQQFIEENRSDLNHCINAAIYRYDGNGGRGQIPNPEPQHSIQEIKSWIQNDEGLYNWARSSGVRV